MKPLAIDLFCGLGGWTDGLLAEQWECVGFDIERHEYGEHRYPAQLVLQDVLTLHGSQFRDASLIVASPPCQEFSYMAMPWSKAKAKRAAILADPAERKRLTALFDACFRIQREAIEAAGHFIPLVVENVRGANEWVGRSRWAYGSFHLWGDVPALMPMVTKRRMKFPAHCGPKMWRDREYVRLDDGNASAFHHEGATKNNDGSWFNIGSPGQKEVGRNPVHEGVKQGGDWFSVPGSISRTTAGNLCPRSHGSKSKARKAASAAIAKIPFALARHIAASWRPA